MSDGVNIDFGALKQPDYLGSYVNAFNVGRQLAGQQIQGNAMTGYGAGAGLRTAIATMDPAQRARGAGTVEVLAAVATGLKAMAYDRRRPVLDHLAPALAARGLDPGSVAAFDATDANLDAHVAEALTLRRMLAGG